MPYRPQKSGKYGQTKTLGAGFLDFTWRFLVVIAFRAFFFDFFFEVSVSILKSMFWKAAQKSAKWRAGANTLRAFDTPTSLGITHDSLAFGGVALVVLTLVRDAAVHGTAHGAALLALRWARRRGRRHPHDIDERRLVG